MKKNNYIHYEVSNWSKKGFESIHNYTYWKNEKYYGLGAGASGYLNDLRYTNTKSITDYINGKTIFYKENVTLNDEFEYQLFLNLRTKEGLDLNFLLDRFKIDLMSTKKDEINKLINNKYLYIDNNRLIPTFKGMMNVDFIVLELLN